MRALVFRMLVILLAIHSSQALANSGMEDAIADVLVWAIVVIVPIVLVAAFWMLHIWPERVAEKRDHPQKDAIQALCLLSLFFGGLLWPAAMLWAYMRPVKVVTVLHRGDEEPHNEPGTTDRLVLGDVTPAAREVVSLREQVVALQRRLDDLDAGRAPPSTS
ncbi:DUF3302 domain-containing protein [Dyella soli]|uniref:DUF3302 domain-containing protein n=1 Tax=Dyella soli TaxID=522319 RepID=UPI00197AC4D1|nr:DUF3302 domain-containing protein [Dyella soli]